MTNRRYGQWAGNPDGYPEDKTRCIIEVWPVGRVSAPLVHQCFRKRGYGPKELYCKQHAKKLKGGGK